MVSIRVIKGNKKVLMGEKKNLVKMKKILDKKIWVSIIGGIA